MGYAHPGQTSRGIHTRLYSRAFIFCEVGNSDKCEVFVVVDFAMGATAINIGVSLGPKERKFHFESAIDKVVI